MSPTAHLRRDRVVLAIGLLLLAAPALAEEIALRVTWTEPTLAGTAGVPWERLKLTRLQWRVWGCLHQPPPGFPGAGEWTWCGYQTGVDVPASSPTGGQAREATILIADGQPWWATFGVRILPLTDNLLPALNQNMALWLVDGNEWEVTVARPQTGEPLKPPTVLGVAP